MRWSTYWIVLTAGLLGVIGLMVGILKWRGYQTSNPPWHIFWDMKYQPKYYPQGESQYFKDGRMGRMPVTGTVPYAGANYFADAGLLRANPDMLKDDDAYYRGIASPPTKEIEIDEPELGADGKPIPVLDDKGQPKKDANNQPIFKTRKVKQTVPNYIRHIPFPVDAALLKRGQERYSIQCSVCHGATGYGNGITTVYGMAGVASYHQDRLREMDDGEIFHTITNGKNTMSAYGYKIPVHDRWAIVAYLRVLQRSQYSPSSDVPEPFRSQLQIP